MPTFEEVYAAHAAAYDDLINREDHEGNILAAVQRIRLLTADLTVVEFGAGTGRLTRLLAPHVAALQAFDASAHMLSVTEAHIARLGLRNVTVQVADNAALPILANSADIAIEGWSFGHQTAWADDWRVTVGAALDEMERVLRPGGTAILLETLGTGSRIPWPPNDALRDLYDWWETERGFRRLEIRTDYRFADAAEAERLCRFFFGDAMGDSIRATGSAIVPECTGVWWKVKP